MPRKFRDSSTNGSNGVSFQRVPDGQFQRFFINIGEMDGMTKKDFLGLLANDFNVPISAVGRIDIKQSYMHFDIMPQFAEKVANGFNGTKIGGRKVRIDSATEKGGGGGGFSKDKKFEKPKFDYDDKKKKKSKHKMAY